MAEGVLVVAATPIGNMDDASPRLRRILAEADVVAAEDTRRLRRLAAALGISLRGRVVAYFDARETKRAGVLLEELRAGRDVVLLTDAGMPLVSDPGYRIVRAAIDAGIRVTCVPGPSALTAALAVGGLPVERFCFEGFLPRRAAERRRRLTELAAETRTMVFFEAPHRIFATLTDMAKAFGPGRAAVVCRELTKEHEEIRRGTLQELAQWAQSGVRGELTLLVAGATEESVASGVPPLAQRVAELQATGVDRRTAIARVAAEAGVPRRQVFDAVVARKREVQSPPDR